MRVFQFFYSSRVVFLGLFEIKFKFFHFPFFLQLLVLLPVINTLLLPFLHEACITLEFVNLDSSEVLLPLKFCFFFWIIPILCKFCLSLFLLNELFNVCLHINLFLRLIKRSKSCFEMFMLNFVKLFHRLCNFLGRLVITKLTCFG